MRRVAALGLAASLMGLSPVLAQEAEPHPSLAEVMQGATSMTTVANAFIFVANAEGGWICAINISSTHFAAIARGDTVVAEETIPSSLCVPATHFKTAVE